MTERNDLNNTQMFPRDFEGKTVRRFEFNLEYAWIEFDDGYIIKFSSNEKYAQLIKFEWSHTSLLTGIPHNNRLENNPMHA